jgi:hypothetical protein
MFTLSTWFCKKQANKAQEQLSQLSLKKPHEREREREGNLDLDQLELLVFGHSVRGALL